MKILVTGGAGFIGSALARFLVEQAGEEVLIVDKLTYAASMNSLDSIASHPGYSFERHDICDFTAMLDVFTRQQPDGVIHLAAETHVDRSIDNSNEFIRTNVVGTHTLLEVARTYWSSLALQRKTDFRFLHVSTDEVYGSLGSTGQFSETTPYDPSSPYSASKAASDHLAVAWHRTHGMPIIVSNCSNNFGPYQFPDKLIPLTILNAFESRELTIYGDGSNVRDWLYVNDHAQALHAIFRRGRVGQKYNVGGRNEWTNIAIVHLICDLLDEMTVDRRRRRLIRFVADRPGHDHRYAIDASKLEQELGWRAMASFEENMRSTVRWYLGNSSWWKPIRNRIYQGQRMGLGTSSRLRN